ncbi:MAG: hypothetical protein GXO58_06235 [Thermodesulfobacteria bacterium]|nr:hypothetical protein [Thermodesulfobacteriota bacterium]
MTAVAIQNLFPGSPTSLGENIAAPVSQTETQSFQNYLTEAEMADAAPQLPVENPETPQAQEDTSMLKELFDLLNIMFGNAGQEEVPTGLDTGQELSLTDTADGTKMSALDQQDSSNWTNGFISELQMILSIFQALTGNTQAAEPQLTDSELTGLITQEPTVDTSVTSQLIQETSPLDIETPVTDPSVSGTEEDAFINTSSLAPGIDLEGELIPDAGAEADTSETSVLIQNTSQDLSEIMENLGTQDDTASVQDSTETTYQVADVQNIAQEASTNDDLVDLRLLTLSYDQNGELDVKELKYSWSGDTKLTSDQLLDQSAIDAATLNSDDSSIIRMTQATIHKKDGSELSLKTVHLSSDFFKNNDLNTTTGTVDAQTNTQIIQTSADDVLTIDFNQGLDADTADQQSADENYNPFADTGTDQTMVGTTSSTTLQATTDSITEQKFGDLVTSQVNEGISQALKMNKNRAVLHLNPPELGTVKVSITVSHNNHVQASFVADHPETRHILEANLQNLKDSLAHNGFSTAQVNVDISGGFTQWSGNQQDQLTPFGMTSMWRETLDSDDESINTPTGISDQGVHVIA